MSNTKANDSTPVLNRGVQTYRLLVAGWYPAKIAKHLRCSESLVWKFAKRYEREQRIERACKFPAMWRLKTSTLHPDMSGGQSTPPTLLPHRLGASFRLIGNIPKPRDASGYVTIKDPAYTIRFGRSKAVLWLKSFTGSTVQDQLANGHKSILALAVKYQHDLGITLTFDRWFPGIDWVLESKKGSKLIGEGANLKEEPKIISGAEFVYDDATHPTNLEIRPAKDYPPLRSTDVAKILEYLITRAPLTLMDIDKRMILQEKDLENIKLYNTNIIKHLAVLDEMSQTLKAIREELNKKELRK